MPIQLSAPKRDEKMRNCSISSCGKYFFCSLVILHSIATRRRALPARMSGAGYFELPEPATRMQLQPASLKSLTSSLSAFVPLALLKNRFSFGLAEAPGSSGNSFFITLFFASFWNAYCQEILCHAAVGKLRLGFLKHFFCVFIARAEMGND